MSFSSSAAAVSYVAEFLAYTETAVRPLPRTFDIQSLSNFAAGLPVELLLCPVRALSEYIYRGCHALLTDLGGSLCRLVVLLVLCRKMVSLSCCEKSLFFSGASSGDVAAPRAHSIHGIATSALVKN